MSHVVNETEESELQERENDEIFYVKASSQSLKNKP